MQGPGPYVFENVDPAGRHWPRLRPADGPETRALRSAPGGSMQHARLRRLHVYVLPLATSREFPAASLRAMDASPSFMWTGWLAARRRSRSRARRTHSSDQPLPAEAIANNYVQYFAHDFSLGPFRARGWSRSSRSHLPPRCYRPLTAPDYFGAKSTHG